jgi:putative Holliday junction resolvase
MDGSEGPKCDFVRSFADEMTNRPEIFGESPFIALWDERLSTFAVDKMLDNHGKKKGKKQEGVVDKLAAHLILQGALDSLTR